MQQIPTHRFTPNTTPFSFEELSPKIRNKENKDIPHRHNYYEVFVFTSGGGTHMIDFKEYPIKTNHLHFISPGMVHSIKRNASCVGVALTFTAELFSLFKQDSIINQIHLYHNHQLAPIITCTKNEMEFCNSILDQIKNEALKSDFMQLEMTLSCLSTLLIQANRKFIKQHQSELPRLFIDPRVQAFKNLLDQPLNEKPTVSSLAEKLGITAKQLTLLLKKNTGISPLEHISVRMLIEAKRLLVNTEYSVKEISYLLFFEDPAYFSRFFRKQTGARPLDFRSEMRKKYH